MNDLAACGMAELGQRGLGGARLQPGTDVGLEPEDAYRRWGRGSGDPCGRGCSDATRRLTASEAVKLVPAENMVSPSAVSVALWR